MKNIKYIKSEEHNEDFNPFIDNVNSEINAYKKYLTFENSLTPQCTSIIEKMSEDDFIEAINLDYIYSEKLPEQFANSVTFHTKLLKKIKNNYPYFFVKTSFLENKDFVISCYDSLKSDPSKFLDFILKRLTHGGILYQLLEKEDSNNYDAIIEKYFLNQHLEHTIPLKKSEKLKNKLKI